MTIKILKTNENLAERLRTLIFKLFHDKILLKLHEVALSSSEKENLSDLNSSDLPTCNFHEILDLNLFPTFIKYLTSVLMYSKLSNVRQRSLELLLQILENLSESASALVPSKIYSEIVDLTLPRLTDVNSNIRILAILALARLQEPEKEEIKRENSNSRSNISHSETQMIMLPRSCKPTGCPIIQAFLERAVSDPIEAVKITALEKVRYTKSSVKIIFPLLKDKSEKVQNAAFTFFNKRVSNLKKLNYEQKVELVKLGLKNETENSQKEQFKFLLKKWLDCIKLADGSCHLVNKVPRLLCHWSGS